jgi:hypothetical protein
MKRRTLGRTLLMALAGLVAVSCSSVGPVAVHAGDQCFRCRQTISETKLAGELIDTSANHFVSKFRTPGCMAKYLADHPEETGTLFVTDYASGHMVHPDRLLFVEFVMNQNTGERDYRAYLNKSDADASALETHSVPVDWKTVLQKARS